MRFKYYRKKKKTNILELSLRCVAHASLQIDLIVLYKKKCWDKKIKYQVIILSGNLNNINNNKKNEKN